jgi:large subunit ribosomal protein L25
MAGERIKLEVQARESIGSAEARRLRAQGLIPGVIYGDGKDTQAFYVGERDLRRAVTGDHGMHAILDVVVAGDGGNARHAVLKDYQLHPTKNRLLHIDLHEVRLDRPIQASVVVELLGESEGAKMGGVVSQNQREVTVEALPMSVPDRLELDISHLQIGDSCRVSDLIAPEDVTILDDPEAVLVTVFQPRVEEEPEPEEVEGEEGEEGVEGEAAEGAEGEEAGEPEAEASGESGDSEE